MFTLLCQQTEREGKKWKRKAIQTIDKGALNPLTNETRRKQRKQTAKQKHKKKPLKISSFLYHDYQITVFYKKNKSEISKQKGHKKKQKQKNNNR